MILYDHYARSNTLVAWQCLTPVDKWSHDGAVSWAETVCRGFRRPNSPNLRSGCNAMLNSNTKGIRRTLKLNSKFLQNFSNSCVFLIFLAALDCKGVCMCGYVLHSLAFFVYVLISRSVWSCSKLAWWPRLSLEELAETLAYLVGYLVLLFATVICQTDSNGTSAYYSLLILLRMWNPWNSRKRAIMGYPVLSNNLCHACALTQQGTASTFNSIPAFSTTYLHQTVEATTNSS